MTETELDTPKYFIQQKYITHPWHDLPIQVKSLKTLEDMTKWCRRQVKTKNEPHMYRIIKRIDVPVVTVYAPYMLGKANDITTRKN